jgi:hypothetical protein
MLTTMTEEDWTIVLRVFEASRSGPAVGLQRGNGHDPVLLQQREYLGSDFLIHMSSPRSPPAWRQLGSAAHIVAGMGPGTRFRFAFTHGERQMPLPNEPSVAGPRSDHRRPLCVAATNNAAQDGISERGRHRLAVGEPHTQSVAENVSYLVWPEEPIFVGAGTFGANSTTCRCLPPRRCRRTLPTKRRM